MDDTSERFQLVELFMAKAGRYGWDRCFHGTIRRERDENGNPLVYGKIKVGDGYIYASALDQWKLGEMLDDIVLLILDFGLHLDEGKVFILNGLKYCWN